MPKSKRSEKSKRPRGRSSTTTFLGSVFTEIAGMQYYDADVEPGEKVQLEREPENEHDANAIRVENKHFHQAGHVPRRLASWLAPLIDSGEVWVEGRVAETKKTGLPDRAYILLELYLHKKGWHILERGGDPRDLPEAFHQAVLAIWHEIDGWTDGDTVSALATRLRAFDTDDLLPKTRMLLALFKHRAWELRRWAGERALENVRDSLHGIELGKALFHHNLTIFPLFSGNGHAPDYLLLQEAIEKKLAEVREVSEAGSVPDLLVDNHAPLPVLIPEGEVLIGAMQDRTVNITILIAASTSHVIPVSCVEQGRWSRISPDFITSHYATPGLRARKIASVQERRRTTGQALSDQSQVWRDVAFSIASVKAASKTQSLADAFKAAKGEINKYSDKLKLPKGAVGVLVASGDEILGMDLFDSPKTMRTIWSRLSKSYFLEAATRDKQKKTLKVVAADFMKALPPIIQLAKKPSGFGQELEFQGEAYAGSGLWYNGRLCHLSAFRVEPGPATGSIPGSIFTQPDI